MCGKELTGECFRDLGSAAEGDFCCEIEAGRRSCRRNSWTSKVFGGPLGNGGGGRGENGQFGYGGTAPRGAAPRGAALVGAGGAFGQSAQALSCYSSAEADTTADGSGNSDGERGGNGSRASGSGGGGRYASPQRSGPSASPFYDVSPDARCGISAGPPASAVLDRWSRAFADAPGELPAWPAPAVLAFSPPPPPPPLPPRPHRRARKQSSREVEGAPLWGSGRAPETRLGGVQTVPVASSFRVLEEMLAAPPAFRQEGGFSALYPDPALFAADIPRRPPTARTVKFESTVFRPFPAQSGPSPTPPPPPGALPLSVFIGNLPAETSVEKLFKLLMQKAGALRELVCDFSDASAWRFAFATFERHENALRAVAFLNGRRALKAAVPHRVVCCFAPQPPPSLTLMAAAQSTGPGSSPGSAALAGSLPPSLLLALLPFRPAFAPPPLPAADGPPSRRDSGDGGRRIGGSSRGDGFEGCGSPLGLSPPPSCGFPADAVGGNYVCGGPCGCLCAGRPTYPWLPLPAGQGAPKPPAALAGLAPPAALAGLAPPAAPAAPVAPAAAPACNFSLLQDGPPGANLFLYGIPSDWTEATLLRLCQGFGHVVGIRVPTVVARGAPGAPGHPRETLNKGFGFVSYDSVAAGAAAMRALRGARLLGKPLNVQLKLGDSPAVGGGGAVGGSGATAAGGPTAGNAAVAPPAANAASFAAAGGVFPAAGSASFAGAAAPPPAAAAATVLVDAIAATLANLLLADAAPAPPPAPPPPPAAAPSPLPALAGAALDAETVRSLVSLLALPAPPAPAPAAPPPHAGPLALEMLRQLLERETRGTQ